MACSFYGFSHLQTSGSHPQTTGPFSWASHPTHTPAGQRVMRSLITPGDGAACHLGAGGGAIDVRFASVHETAQIHTQKQRQVCRPKSGFIFYARTQSRRSSPAAARANRAGKPDAKAEHRRLLLL